MKRALLLLAASVSASSSGCDCAGDGGLNQVRPVIQAVPNPLPFDEAFIGLTAARSLSIKNIGTSNLVVSGLRVKPGSHPGLAVETWAGELAPNNDHASIVRLTVDALGPVSGAILVDSNDPATPTLEVPIVASGSRRPGAAISVCVEAAGAPRLCVDPLSVDLGMVPVGIAKKATVTISSAGDLPLVIQSTAFSAGSHPDFSATPLLTAETLMPGDSRTVEVTLTPTREEMHSAVLEVLSNDIERDRVPVVFVAQGLSAALCADPASIDFGTVSRGQMIDRTITLTACGRAAVDLTGLETSAPEFTIVTPPMTPQTLPPGATVTVDVRYAPADLGRDAALFRARSTGGDAVVNLTGRTELCDIDVLPSMVAFGGIAQGRTRSINLVIQNAGTAACTVSALRLGGSTEFRLPMPIVPPRMLSPGATETLAVEYAPTDAGADMGQIEISSDDAADPLITVPLSGRRLEAGECQLSVTPDPISFGIVALGQSRILGATITNNGTSVCTLGSIAPSLGSDPDFAIAMSPVLPILAGGRSTTIQVEFRPSETGRRTGTIEIQTGLLGRNPPITVAVDGNGSGARLCMSPKTVIFGTHPIGVGTDRQVTLTACGTEAVVMSALELPAPTSSEFQILAAPALPLTLAAGTALTVSVRYTGSAIGRDEGVLRVDSNDQIEARQEADLIAATGMGCGDLSGRICGLDGVAPAQGVTVYVDTPLGRQQATTNADGDYYLTCVPGGDWTVHASSGSWSTEFSATINEGSSTSFPSQVCLETSSAKVAVVWGEWDQIETILTGLNVPYTFYDENSQADLLNDFAEMSQYDVIFLNCGMNDLLATSGQGFNNLQAFVAGGGSVYASDWAYDAIEIGWPMYIDFFNNDADRDSAQSAGNYRGAATIVEPSLRRAIGRQQVPIDSCCTGIEAAGPGTTTYLEGDRYNDGSMHPLFVSFSPGNGAGTVMYTDFHNTGQRDIVAVFRWLITRL